MSGLDRITKSILEEAKEESRKLLEHAQQEIEAQDREEKARQQQREQEFFAGVDKECHEYLEMEAGKNRQERRQQLLAVRREAINQVLEEAKQTILQMPEEEYFEFLFQLFQKNAQSGIIYFAPEDYDRLPKKFVRRCAAELADGDLTDGGVREDIRHGFVIVHGKIEQNCSLEDIFEENQNEFWDLAGRCLAGEEGEGNP